VGVLALPATAIRRVNAGLVVGNPVGSTNTRAKALTSAELKAIIEASGISYLPLSGGTLTGALSLGANALTCGAITTSGNLAIRDGLNAMQAEVFRTFTSATTYESLSLKTTSTAMQIGSAKGSVGGTSRPVQLGHFDSAGQFASALSVAIDGAISIPGAATISGSVALGVGSSVTWSTRGSLRLIASNQFRFTSSDASTGFVLSSAINNELTVLSLNGTAAGNLSCGAITASSDLTLVPSSSRTLSTNGQFSIEMTSNTAGNLVYRGSDGTERRNPQVFYPSGSMQRTLVHAPTWSTYTPAGAATATLLLSDTGSNLHRVTRPVSGDITIAFSGDSANQLFLLVLQTSGSGTPGTVTWPSGITWLTDSGAAPTISTAIDKTDSIMFQRTGSGTYLGWHTGKN